MALTKASIERAKYEGDGNERCVKWDDDLPGFGVRVYPSGRKAFVLSYRNAEGRKRLTTLGTFGPVTLHEAKARARRFMGEIIEGDDPQANREHKRGGATVADLCRDYLERHAKPHKKTWKKDQQRIERHILPRWASRKCESITRSEFAELHRKLGRNAPYEANRVLALVRKMFNLAVVWAYVPETFTNPATRVQQYRETKRDRWIKPDELPRLVAAIETEESVYVRGALWLYILTGVRRSELLNAKWTDVDFDRAELRIPDTKAGRAHVVPLSGQALAVLSGLPRLDGNPHILPGHRTGRPLVNIDKPWYRIRKEAGLEDVRLHDLRRTVGSWLAMDGTSLLVIGKTLNQTTPATTQVYARLNEDPVRKALERHGAKFQSVIQKRDGNNIGRKQTTQASDKAAE
ncbi:MAG: tyrosine-type recombinase/integrase [Planctomycetaceae bacterium]|nr:tyrosine-type recombinase/integrase [Planctomycetaceae bacterium]